MAKLGYDPKKLNTCITEGIGDCVINHPKAKHEFEYLRIEEVIPTIKKHLKSN